MRRFFVDRIEERNGLCVITGPEARHMTRVLRMEPGDSLVLMDGGGKRFQARIESVAPKHVQVILQESLPSLPPSPIKITLCQALLKSRPMDYLIQKTSELGVDSIFPFTSKRTVVRLTDERMENKIRHWRQIALNAAKQSGRPAPAEIAAPAPLGELLERWRNEDCLKFILWEQEEAKDLKSLLNQPPWRARVIGVVGPEGGFDRQEIKAALDAGFISISLGQRVLRSETAAAALIAILQYECGDLSPIGAQIRYP